MKFIAISTFALILLATNLIIGEADDTPSEYVISTHQVMVKASMEFHAPYEQMRYVATCESGTSMVPVGREGEIGAFQFKKKTFEGMSKEMGESLDIHSLNDQSRLYAWVSVNRPKWLTQWTCYRKFKAIK